MTRWVGFAVLACVATAACAGIAPAEAARAPVHAPAPPAAQRDSARRAGAAVAQFGFDLFARIRHTPGNACLSPLSVELALAIAREGAAGSTAEQMSTTLHLDSGASAGFAALRRQLSPRDSAYDLTIANALWADGAARLQPRYVERVEAPYDAHLERVDFADPPRACDAINSWVSAKTRGLIPSLISPAAISAATRLVITDAVYFKGRWEHAFDEASTSREEFVSKPGTAKAVSFMHATRSYRYAEDARAQVLDLPYAGGGLEMLVILPRTSPSREAVERGLSLEAVNRWLAAMRERTVELHLPRFRLDAEYALEQELPAMGMSDAFDPRQADFSGVDGRRDLFIGTVRHRTFVRVEETGTTAAAATGAMMPTALIRPVPQPPVVFRADHPFLFVIRDSRSGVVLFLGRVVQPEG